MKIKITWTRVINLCLERRTPHLNKLINELSWFDASDATIDERVDHWRCFPGAARSSEGNDGRALYCDWLNSCELFKFCYTKIWPDIVDVRGFVSIGWLSCRFLILLGRGPVCGDGDCGKPSAVFGLKFGSADQKGHPFMTTEKISPLSYHAKKLTFFCTRIISFLDGITSVNFCQYKLFI